MEQTNIGKKLYTLAHENKTADAVIHALASRERLRHFIDIRRLKYNLKREGFKILDDEFINLWKEWEKMGLGSIVRGRIGKEDRFMMNYDMRKVAEASLKGTDLTPNDVKKGVVLKTKANSDSVTTTSKRRGRKPKIIRNPVSNSVIIPPIEKSIQVIIPLNGSDDMVRISLPFGISKKDIDLISNALYQVV